MIVCEKDQNEPYLLVLGSLQNPMQSLLIVDQEILCEIDIEDSPFAIISFFLFLTCYTRSLIYVFTFLETVLLNLVPQLSPTVANFLSVIKSV